MPACIELQSNEKDRRLKPASTRFLQFQKTLRQVIVRHMLYIGAAERG